MDTACLQEGAVIGGIVGDLTLGCGARVGLGRLVGLVGLVGWLGFGDGKGIVVGSVGARRDMPL